MIRRFVTKLHDELTEVGFDDGVTFFFQRVIQMNFFARHRFGLDDGARFFVAENLRNDFARLRAVARPMNFCAARFELGDERFEMRIKLDKVVSLRWRFIPIGRGTKLLKENSESDRQ